MSKNEILKFSNNLSSRLCHDLITPTGAINTGLELLLEQDDLKSQESQEIMDLIRQSALTANNRLAFYRVAFGNSGQNISMGDAQRLVERYFEGSKLTLHWSNDLDPHYMLATWGRLLMNAAVWVGESAPRGGDMHIYPPTPSQKTLEIRLEGPQIIIHEEVKEALQKKIDPKEFSPRTIHSTLLLLVAEDLDATINLELPHSSELILKVS